MIKKCRFFSDFSNNEFLLLHSLRSGGWSGSIWIVGTLRRIVSIPHFPAKAICEPEGCLPLINVYRLDFFPGAFGEPLGALGRPREAFEILVNVETFRSGSPVAPGTQGTFETSVNSRKSLGSPVDFEHRFEGSLGSLRGALGSLRDPW